MGGKSYKWTEARFNRYKKEGRERGTGELENYQPWSIDLPSRCRVPKKSELNKK